MFEGLVRHYEQIRLRLEVAASPSGTSGPGDQDWSVDGSCIAWRALTPTGPEFETPSWALEHGSWIQNIKMAVFRNQAGDTWQFQWMDKPGVGADPWYMATGTGAHELLLEIDDYKLYTRFDGTWRLRMGEARLYVGGSLYETFTAQQIDGGMITPFEVPCPFHCVAGYGNGSSATNVSPSQAEAAGWSYTSGSSVTGSVTFGWQYDEDGDTVSPPVTWMTPVLPTLTDAEVSVGSITGATAWESVIEVYAMDDLEDRWCKPDGGHVLSNPWREHESRGGLGFAFATWDRAVGRMVTPSEDLVVRGGFPQVTRVGSRTKSLSSTYFPEVGPGTQTSTQTSATVLSEVPSMLLPTGNEPGLIEEPMSETLYSPCYLVGSKGQAGEVGIDHVWGDGPPTCPFPDWRTGKIAKGNSAFFAYPEYVQTLDAPDAMTANADIIVPLTHPEALFRLYSTWHCPHWSYFLWMPPNTIDTNADEILDSQDVWEVFGSDVASEYWQKSRQQWINHPDLDPGDATSRRNLVRSEPMSDSRLVGMWQDYFTGCPTSPWGISNFIAQIPDVPESLETDSDSESLVSALEDCTVDASGSTIVVNPSASTCEVAMGLASFDTKPWLFAAMSREFKFGWSTSNVEAVNVYAEGWDGERVLLVADDDRGAWKSWPTGGAVKFAGSWSQDFGRGYITDDGADVDGDGISAATMGDIVRAHVPGLLPGRTCRRIVWVIQVEDVDAYATLNWPEYRHTEHQYIPEIAQQGIFVSPNGPGVRFGNAAWWNRSIDAFSDPPILQGPETMPSILDMLCARRVYFEGKAADDGLNDEIEELFEDGIEYTIVRKHQAVDPTDGGQSVHGFWVQGADGPVSILVSSLREPPPMGSYASRDRDTNFQPTSTRLLKTWIAHEKRRYYVSSKAPLTLSETVDVTDPDTSIVLSGWKVRFHELAVDNGEGLYDVNTDLASLRPWHGSSAVIDALLTGQGISYDVHPNARHAVAFVENGIVQLGFSDNHNLPDISIGDTGMHGDEVVIAFVKSGLSATLRLYVVDSGSITRYETKNEGQTFDGGTARGSGTRVIAFQAANNREYVYRIDGGAIKGTIYDAQGNEVESEFTVVASGADDAQIGGFGWFHSESKYRIVLWYVASGTPTRIESIDGKTFSP